MIKVVAKSFIKKDKVDEFKILAVPLVAETVKEKGCISYQLYQDVKIDTILCFIEEWESQEALQKHMQSSHFQEIVPKLRELQEKDSEVNIYTSAL